MDQARVLDKLLIQLLLLLPLVFRNVQSRHTPNTFPTYTGYCNETFSLSGRGSSASEYAGTISFRVYHQPDTGCYVTVKQTNEYRYLKYRIFGLVPCHCQSCSNENVVIVSFLDYSTFRFKSMAFCYSQSSDTTTSDDWLSTRSGELILSIANITVTSFAFDLEFYTYHDGPCASDEVECGGCIDRQLACNHGKYICGSSDFCSDIINDKKTSGLVSGLVTGAVFSALIFIICCVFIKRDKVPCFRHIGNTRSNSDDIVTRARAIFTVQLASRGVTSDDEGNDNAAYTEDGERIDPSLLQPPPEYSSLENIDQQGKSYPDNADLPPSYDDALENREKYKVAIDIPDNT